MRMEISAPLLALAGHFTPLSQILKPHHPAESIDMKQQAKEMNWAGSSLAPRCINGDLRETLLGKSLDVSGLFLRKSLMAVSLNTIH